MVRQEPVPGSKINSFPSLELASTDPAESSSATDSVNTQPLPSSEDKAILPPGISA